MVSTSIIDNHPFHHSRFPQEVKDKIRDAISSDNVEKFAQLVNEYPGLINLVWDTGGTLIGGAVYTAPKICCLLLDKGARPIQHLGEDDASEPETLFLLAAKYGQLEVVKKLIEEKGVDIRQKCGTGSAVHLASAVVADYLCSRDRTLANWNLLGIGTPLHKAALQKDEQKISTLLKHGADVNSRATIRGWPFEGDGDVTPLHCANDINCMKLLCEQGADVNAITQKGRTPLSCIAYKDNALTPLSVPVDKIDYLLSRGAKLEHGGSPYVKATYYGEAGIIRYLLSKGADARNGFELQNPINVGHGVRDADTGRDTDYCKFILAVNGAGATWEHPKASIKILKNLAAEDAQRFDKIVSQAIESGALQQQQIPNPHSNYKRYANFAFLIGMASRIAKSCALPDEYVVEMIRHSPKDFSATLEKDLRFCDFGDASRVNETLSDFTQYTLLPEVVRRVSEKAGVFDEAKKKSVREKSSKLMEKLRPVAASILFNGKDVADIMKMNERWQARRNVLLMSKKEPDGTVRGIRDYPEHDAWDLLIPEGVISVPANLAQGYTIREVNTFKDGERLGVRLENCYGDDRFGGGLYAGGKMAIFSINAEDGRELAMFEINRFFENGTHQVKFKDGVILGKYSLPKELKDIVDWFCEGINEGRIMVDERANRREQPEEGWSIFAKIGYAPIAENVERAWNTFKDKRLNPIRTDDKTGLPLVDEDESQKRGATVFRQSRHATFLPPEYRDLSLQEVIRKVGGGKTITALAASVAKSITSKSHEPD